MNVEKVIEQLEREQTSPDVRYVFGEAVARGDRTVIPVARVRRAYGWGVGEGKGRSSPMERDTGWGGGQGGYLSAKPVAIVEITPEQTRVIPIPDVTRLALLGMVVAAWNVFWVTRTIRVGRNRR